MLGDARCLSMTVVVVMVVVVMVVVIVLMWPRFARHQPG